MLSFLPKITTGQSYIKYSLCIKSSIFYITDHLETNESQRFQAIYILYIRPTDIKTSFRFTLFKSVYPLYGMWPNQSIRPIRMGAETISVHSPAISPHSQGIWSICKQQTWNG